MGDGERTSVNVTDGIRACFFELEEMVRDGLRAVGSIGADEDDAVVAVGSQVKPGLIIKLTVSPSLMLYSLRSLVSVRAFPFRRSL